MAVYSTLYGRIKPNIKCAKSSGHFLSGQSFDLWPGAERMSRPGWKMSTAKLYTALLDAHSFLSGLKARFSVW